MGTFGTGLFNETLFNAGAAVTPANLPQQIQVSDIIYSAYRIAGVLAEAQRGLSASDKKDGLLWLNDMVDGWKSQRLMVYAILRTVFGLTPGKGGESNPYTIGLDTSGTAPDFLIERPEQINAAGFIFTNVSPNIEVPVAILNDQEWQATSPKDLKGPIPSRLYYRPNVPNGSIILWMVPNVAYQLALYTWRTVNAFTTVNDPVVVPPQFMEALKYNLAVRIAGIFPNRQKMAPKSYDIASASLKRIKTINAPEMIAQCERAALGTKAEGSYNILSNRYQ